MEIKTMIIIVGAVAVAVAAGSVAFKYVTGNRTSDQSVQGDGASQANLLVKLIILGLLMFAGLAMFYLFRQQGGG